MLRISVRAGTSLDICTEVNLGIRTVEHAYLGAREVSAGTEVKSQRRLQEPESLSPGTAHVAPRNPETDSGGREISPPRYEKTR